MIPNKGVAIEMAVVGELNITDPPYNAHVQKFWKIKSVHLSAQLPSWKVLLGILTLPFQR